MNNKYFYLFMSFILVSQTSCIQQQGPSEKEIQERIDAAVQAALEKKGEESTSSSNQPTISSSSTSTSTSSSGDAMKKKAYDAGHRSGLFHQNVELEYYIENNEEELKDLYILACVSSLYGIGEENINNRELYNEFRRGFIKAHKDCNNALN